MKEGDRDTRGGNDAHLSNIPSDVIDPSEPDPQATGRGNVAGIVAMLASMACFVANDTLLKLASAHLPLGEMIFLRNTVATAFVAVLAMAGGGFATVRGAPLRLIGLRVVGEVGATILYLTALLLMTIGDITAIGQFTPLVLTAAGAIFLGEPVGWRRWLAAGAGFLGVLLIVRPGSSAFAPAAGIVFAAMGFVVLRDLATRLIPTTVPTLFITFLSSAAVLIASFAFLPFETWIWPPASDAALVAAAGVFLSGGYVLIIVAVRAGEIAVVSPFRYSVMIYALIAGFAVWSEAPDGLSLLGVAIVIGAGLYTFHREHVRRGGAAIPIRPASP